MCPSAAHLQPVMVYSDSTALHPNTIPNENRASVSMGLSARGGFALLIVVILVMSDALIAIGY